MYEEGDDRLSLKAAIEGAGDFRTAAVITGPSAVTLRLTAASLRTHFPAALRTGDPAGALDASR